MLIIQASDADLHSVSRRGDTVAGMMHPHGKSVVRDHARHCKQRLGAEGGELGALTQNKAAEIDLG